MTRSEQINELAAALAKAQASVEGAKKDAENPHFRSRYADLASVWDACRAALTSNGLSVVQFPRLACLGEDRWMVEVESTLLHTSGQWMSESLALPLGKVDAQGVGSAITYGRRYALAAIAGVAPEDDDGNAAVSGAKFKTIEKIPTITKAQGETIIATAKKHGWTDEATFKKYLKTYLKTERVLDIPARSYDDVIQALEQGPDYEAPL